MGQKRGNMRTTQGQSGGASPVAPPPARTWVRNMGTARARRRHAVERGHVAQLSANSVEVRTPVVPREGRTASDQKGVASGAAGGFIGRQPVTVQTYYATTTRMKKMGEMGRKRWLDDLYGNNLHCIWPRRKPYGLIVRARGKSLPGPAHGLEPAAQQLRPLGCPVRR